MKARALGTVFILILLIIAIPATIFLSKQRQELRKKAAPATTLVLTPSSMSKYAGDRFSVDVVVNTGENTVSAAEIHVAFDETALKAETVEPGTFLSTILIPGKVSSTEAEITLGSPPTSPKKGEGIIATVKFLVIGASGTSQIRLTEKTQVAGIGEAGNVLVGKTPASVTITQGQELPTPTVSATPRPQATVTPPVAPSPTHTPGATNTPTPTTRPNATATPAPTKSAGTGGTSVVSLTTSRPRSGEVVTTSTPTFSGTAVPGSTITITIESNNPISGSGVADSSGNWTFNPGVALADGSHTLTVTAVSPTGASSTITRTFNVSTGTIPVSGNELPTLLTISLGVGMMLFGFGFRFLR